MSTLYLIDAHTPVVANSRIVGVQQSSSLITDVVSNGCFPVFVPSGIDVGSPTTVGELNTAKFAALQSMYGGSNIVYEDFLQSPGIAPGAGVLIGDRVTTHCSDGSVRISTIDLAPGPILKGTLVFDAFTKKSELATVSTPDLRDGRRLLTRISEKDPGSITARCLFNVSLPIPLQFYNGVTQPVELAYIGSNLIVDFIDLAAAQAFYLGSWAFIY